MKAKFSILSFLAFFYAASLFAQSSVNITFRVNITNYLNAGNNLSQQGIRIAGNFATIGVANHEDWAPWDPNGVMLAEGNNWWTKTIVFPASAVGQTFQYKFVNGADWGANENWQTTEGNGCVLQDESGFINRALLIPSTNTTVSYCWDECNTTCATIEPNGSFQYQISSTIQSCQGNSLSISISVSPLINISTNSITSITSSSALSGGAITNDGGNAVSQRGVCWSISPNPTTANFSTSDGSGLSNFSSNLTGLSPNTTYYVRAYAINSAGTFYGNEVSFTTISADSGTYPPGSVFCTGTPTAVVEVTNPTTGRIWMDRNLGATQAATSSTDAAAFGDLYQWGRGADGHQCRNSSTTFILSSTDAPGHADFISVPSPSSDWRAPQNNNLWQELTEINNPCPIGYRIPTYIELNEERTTWNANNSTGAYNSPLRFTMGGFRYGLGGAIFPPGTSGFYYSISVVQNTARSLYFDNGGANISSPLGRGFAYSVRCIKKEFPPAQGAINIIDCSSATNNGTLTSGVVASGVNSVLPYVGGNGGSYNLQTVQSTGVTGLTATLAAGNFENGVGSLTYTISGTPSASGTASFALNIGGQSCILSRTVNTSGNTGSTATCGAENVHNPSLNYGSMTDQDGNTYKTIVIGTQEWMAENLKTSKYRNGDPIPHVVANWSSLNTGGYCWYNNDSAGYDCPYGKLYNGFAITDNRNVCPSGWHIPNDVEWNTLFNFLGGSNVAGSKMKSANNVFWNQPSLESDNSSGFSGIPGGYRSGFFDVYFDTLGFGGFWHNNSGCAGAILGFNFESTNYWGYIGCDVAPFFWQGPSAGISARCINDSSINLLPIIDSLMCSDFSTIGSINQGSPASGVSVNIPYISGNGGPYEAQTISSFGVSGLTANLSQGYLTNGDGNFVLTISGIAETTGYANFNFVFNNHSCLISIPVLSNIPSIGSQLNGGIVAYVLQPGDPGYNPDIPHGLIAASSDLPSNSIWGCFGQSIGGTSSLFGTGSLNTDTIFNACSTVDIAARQCNNLVLNGYLDWHLPSLAELEKLYQNQLQIGGFNSSAFYWSSTEFNSNQAYCLFFGGGSNTNSKQNSYKVRPVRYF